MQKQSSDVSILALKMGGDLAAQKDLQKLLLILTVSIYLAILTT